MSWREGARRTSLDANLLSLIEVQFVAALLGQSWRRSRPAAP
jgi:hypothetical protein